MFGFGSSFFLNCVSVYREVKGFGKRSLLACTALFARVTGDPALGCVVRRIDLNIKHARVYRRELFWRPFGCPAMVCWELF